MKDLHIRLMASLTGIVGFGTPVVTALVAKGTAPFTLRDILVMVLGGLVGAATTLLAFFSKVYADSTTTTPTTP